MIPKQLRRKVLNSSVGMLQQFDKDSHVDLTDRLLMVALKQFHGPESNQTGLSIPDQIDQVRCPFRSLPNLRPIRRSAEIGQ